MPDITLAITIRIDSKRVESCWNKLRVSHSARPGPCHLVRRDVATLQDFERRQKLLAPERGPAAAISKGRQRLCNTVRSHKRPITAFQPPDCHQHMPVYAIGLFKPGKCCPMLRQHIATVHNACVGYGRRKIIPDGSHKFRLVIVGRHHLHIRHNPAHGTVEGARGNPL